MAYNDLRIMYSLSMSQLLNDSYTYDGQLMIAPPVYDSYHLKPKLSYPGFPSSNHIAEQAALFEQKKKKKKKKKKGTSQPKSQTNQRSIRMFKYKTHPFRMTSRYR